MEINPDEPVSHCKTCGAPIVWRKTEAGRMMPVNVSDGLTHFGSCPQSKDWSKSKPRKPKPEAVEEELPW